MRSETRRPGARFQLLHRRRGQSGHAGEIQTRRSGTGGGESVSQVDYSQMGVLGGALLLLIAISVGSFLFGPREKTTASVPSSPIPDKSIAVLPFDNLSRDPENAYFADGIQDEILTRLSKIADLKVISRTSTQHYKSAPDKSARDRKAAWRGPHPGRKRAKERRCRARQRAADQSGQ